MAGAITDQWQDVLEALKTARRALTALQRAGRARMVRQKSEHGREVEAWHANPVVDHAAKTTGYLAKAKAVLDEIERAHERM